MERAAVDREVPEWAVGALDLGWEAVARVDPAQDLEWEAAARAAQEREAVAREARVRVWDRAKQGRSQVENKVRVLDRLRAKHMLLRRRSDWPALGRDGARSLPMNLCLSAIRYRHCSTRGRSRLG